MKNEYMNVHFTRLGHAGLCSDADTTVLAIRIETSYQTAITNVPRLSQAHQCGGER